MTAVVPEAPTPSALPPRPWKSASYSDWNEWLFADTFTRSQSPEPIRYIPASLKELCVIVGESPERAQEVLQAFSDAICQELDKERCTFESYYLQYRLRSGSRDAYWSRFSDEEPYFFACLWLTCLVASGYPPYEGQFYPRMGLVLGRPVSSFSSTRESGSLEDVWEDLADWTQRHRDRYRELILPPRDTYRKIIGRSFYLAFPNHADRLQLRAVLEKADLLVDKPPITPVLEALRRSKKVFGKEFQKELDSFFDKYLQSGRDPGESPFWRAVAQEASTPSLERTGGAERTGQTTLMARFDQDDLLELYIACTEQYPDKPGFTREALGFDAGEFRYRLVPQAPSSSQRLVFDQLLTGTSRRTFASGVLPLLRVITGEYRLAHGEELAECDRALVRDDRVEAFVRTFGGKKTQCALPGWQEVEGCQLHQLDSPPEGLEGVYTLLHTTEPQRPHFVGGLRTSMGGFYRLNGYLPRIHAPGAEKVEVAIASSWLPCQRVTGEQQVEEWLLPAGLDDALEELRVAATWKVHIEGYALERRGEAKVSLDALSLAIDHKGLPSGDFWLETTSRRLETLRGPVDKIPLGFTTWDRTRTMDMLFFDATARWLGPGVGEMSLVPNKGFPWLAIGPNNSPTMIVFVGDAQKPVLPDDDFSSLQKDRRHWKRAFSGGTGSVFVREGAEYVPLDERPEVQTIHSAYVKAAHSSVRPAGSECAPTDLDRYLQDTEKVSGDYSREAALLLDVLSSIAHSRSGIPLREVHEHLARLTHTDEHHSLRYHLLRALAEVGAIDTLLRLNGRQTLVVARKPRLVISRRGNRFSGTVLGLLPRTISRRVEPEGRKRGLQVTYAAPPNRFQPPVIHLEAEDGAVEPLEALSRELAFAPPEFLDWPDASLVPPHFTVREELARDEPPEMYVREATWCWKSGAFKLNAEEPGEVSIERRSDGQRAPIYVVTRAGTPVGWSYSRAWALLDATERAGRPPFTLEGGVLRAMAHAPLHLPLPLARLCTVVGAGAPGPRIEERAGRPVVTSYVYPFGRKLAPLAARAVPESWIQRKVE